MPFDATPRKVNEVSVGLRKMAEWFRENGFTPTGHKCFIASAVAVHCSDGECYFRAASASNAILNDALHYREGNNLTLFLITAGYPADPTGEKAAQLCERVAAELEA